MPLRFQARFELTVNHSMSAFLRRKCPLNFKKMQVNEIIWSEAEQKVAEAAFQKAYERETNTLIQEIRESASAITELDQIWRLHDFLSARRHEIDGKYDFSYSVLLFVFATFIKQGWLKQADLEGLEKDKLAKIASLARM
jgi:Photoprotection regulator fluorescence recovery protein